MDKQHKRSFRLYALAALTVLLVGQGINQGGGHDEFASAYAAQLSQTGARSLNKYASSSSSASVEESASKGGGGSFDMGFGADLFSGIGNQFAALTSPSQNTLDKKETIESTEVIDNLSNPSELVKSICETFKLNKSKFIEAVGKSLVFGIEVALTPFAYVLKIVEKVFVPDNCRLHFVCNIGSQMSFFREHVSKFSSDFGEGSSLIQAFGDGIFGGSCVNKYRCVDGGPRLKQEYEALKRES